MSPLLADVLVKPDPAFATLLCTLVIPLIVGLITKKYATKAVKALTNAVAVAITATVVLSVTSDLTLRAFLTLTIVGFITSSAAHEFLWKNLGISEVIADALPGTGFGRAIRSPLANVAPEAPGGPRGGV